jgi:hypothetical protein
MDAARMPAQVLGKDVAVLTAEDLGVAGGGGEDDQIAAARHGVGQLDERPQDGQITVQTLGPADDQQGAMGVRAGGVMAALFTPLRIMRVGNRAERGLLKAILPVR